MAAFDSWWSVVEIFFLGIPHKERALLVNWRGKYGEILVIISKDLPNQQIKKSIEIIQVN